MKKKKKKKKKKKFSFRTSSGNLIKSSEIDEILSKNKDHLKAFISIKFKSYSTFWSKTFLKSCAWSLVVVELIHFFPKFSSDLPWKYQKNLWLSMFPRRSKRCTGKKFAKVKLLPLKFARTRRTLRKNQINPHINFQGNLSKFLQKPLLLKPLSVKLLVTSNKSFCHNCFSGNFPK